MKLGYTEFSFGYAFTENLIRWSALRPVGAPVFPNLVQEARLGYDVRIDLPGCPLFFQYKLPELMVRDSAAEVAKYALPGLSVPFFRMPLMRRDLSDQHRLLIDLEQQFRDTVYYVTPCLQDVASFNAAYKVAKVHHHSVFFSPGDIGPLPDHTQHVVVYRSGSTRAWMHSEPREIQPLQFEHISQKVQDLFADQRYLTLQEAAGAIRAGVIERVPPEIRNAENDIRQHIRSRSTIPAVIEPESRSVAEDLLVSREIARIGLGLDMAIAQPQAY